MAAALPEDGRRGDAGCAIESKEGGRREAGGGKTKVGGGTGRRATKMPLIVVANSPHKDEALAGLERWKKRHRAAAKHLAVDDILVDSMRGRSSTWTRIRLNLRNVPEKIRPAQEKPDPDDDPTREWRESAGKR